MAESNRLGVIILPAFVYGGIVSLATDFSIAFFYDISLNNPHIGLYFWGQTILMTVWNLLWYPRLLWWWTSDEFYYPHSTWKMTYKTALFYSFFLQVLNTLLTGLCTQKLIPDPYFSSRLLHTPCSTFCTLFLFECVGFNSMIRRVLLRDL
jgi:hypothetical protein